MSTSPESPGEDETPPPAVFPARMRAAVQEVQRAGDDDGAPPSRPPTGLSLEAVARAELALDHPVELTNGGSHVSFTAEDIRRIRDPAVLQFMSEHSLLFSKYLPEDGSTEDPAAAVASTGQPGAAAAADVEADILRLQAEIDTFITAVDEDGKNYRIHMQGGDSVALPIADEASDVGSLSGVVAELNTLSAAVDDETDDASPEGGEEGAETAAPEDVTASAEAGALVTTSNDGNTGRLSASPAPEEEGLSTEPKAGAEGGGGARATATLPVPARSLLQKPRGKASKGPGGPKPRGKAAGAKKIRALAAPAHAARPAHGLRPDEEARVELLLQPAWLTEPSPFTIPEDVQARLAELDDQLASMRVLRRAGGLPTTPADEDGSEEDGEGGRPSRPDSQKTAGASSGRRGEGTTATELGDAYLAEVRSRMRQRRKVQAVNAALRRVHREMEVLVDAADAARLPEDVRAMRPSWVEQTVELPDEESIGFMLAEAEEEQRRGVVMGRPLPPPRPAADPYSPLLSSLGEARQRVHLLLEKLAHDDPPARSDPHEGEEAV